MHVSTLHTVRVSHEDISSEIIPDYQRKNYLLQGKERCFRSSIFKTMLSGFPDINCLNTASLKVLFGKTLSTSLGSFLR